MTSRLTIMGITQRRASLLAQPEIRLSGVAGGRRATAVIGTDASN